MADVTGADPVVTTLMDAAYSSLYGQVYRTHWWWRAREENVVHVLRTLLPEPDGAAKILDIGCGDGYIWPRIARYGSVEGIEPDEGLVAPGSPYRDRIELAGLLDGRARGGDHDLVLMLDVLEHIEDEESALARVVALLRVNGAFLITVPALTSLWSEFDQLSGHVRRYSKQTLRAALERAGLRVVYLRYSYVWTVLPLFARRLLFKSEGAENSHFVKPPARPVNALLRQLSLLDHALTRKIPVPFGSSLIAVAVRPAQSVPPTK